MANAKLFLALCAPALILVACASTSSESLTSQQAVSPQDSVQLVADANTAVLTIARGDLSNSYLRSARILVNGEEIGDISDKQWVSVAVPPGSHEVELKLKSNGYEKGGSFKLEAQADQTYNYHLKSYTSRSSSGTVGFGASFVNSLKVVRFVPTSENYAP